MGLFTPANQRNTMHLKLTAEFNASIEAIQTEWHTIYTRRKLTKAEIAHKCIRWGLEAWSETPDLHPEIIIDDKLTGPLIKLKPFPDDAAGLIRRIARMYDMSIPAAYNSIGEIGAGVWSREIEQIKNSAIV